MVWIHIRTAVVPSTALSDVPAARWCGHSIECRSQVPARENSLPPRLAKDYLAWSPTTSTEAANRSGCGHDRCNAPSPSRSPRWPKVDLGKVTKLDRAQVFPYWDGARFYQYKVELSTNDKEWNQVVDMSANTKPAVVTGDMHKIAPADARYELQRRVPYAAAESRLQPIFNSLAFRWRAA